MPDAWCLMPTRHTVHSLVATVSALHELRAIFPYLVLFHAIGLCTKMASPKHRETVILEYLERLSVQNTVVKISTLTCVAVRPHLVAAVRTW